MNDAIRIKPHHFVDIVTSFGAGKRTFEPHPYGHAVHSVSQTIWENADVVLQIDLGADAICEPCVHNIDGQCDDVIDTSYRPEAPSSKMAWNLLIDKRWCERLQIERDDRFTARELCKRIQERMGDITDIYREIPPDRTASRQSNLIEGLKIYLNKKSA